ncbi:hypothetical protein ABK905_12620 [Acerihabitans sp. KWT182]|uniref:AraC-type arabinose-binding/dimerisation domain-containing protein n=1 Tax=Acerihabitans sp. KWT182 TaxID=3157919 RepID=A0AAU7QF10_9GAMM
MNSKARIGENLSPAVSLSAAVESSGQCVSFISYRYRHLQSEVWHAHKTAQLTYASQGSIQIYTAAGIWTLPPPTGGCGSLPNYRTRFMRWGTRSPITSIYRKRRASRRWGNFA